MNVPHSLILEQKENTKHGEVFFPIQKYITKLIINFISNFRLSA